MPASLNIPGQHLFTPITQFNHLLCLSFFPLQLTLSPLPNVLTSDNDPSLVLDSCMSAAFIHGNRLAQPCHSQCEHMVIRSASLYSGSSGREGRCQLVHASGKEGSVGHVYSCSKYVGIKRIEWGKKCIHDLAVTSTTTMPSFPTNSLADRQPLVLSKCSSA